MLTAALWIVTAFASGTATVLLLIIVLIKAAAFQHKATAASNQPLQFAPTFGTLDQWRIAHALKCFDMMTAILTLILIRWHN
jgi:hypothetical protein